MSANTATVEGTSRGTLLVVDGHSLAFRAFFALPVENFSTSEGQATNAVWGFTNMLSQVIDAEHPDHLAVAFDVKGGTFRNKMLPQYKGTRDAAPQELLSQLPLIQRLLTALGITYIEKPGYEGDDVIGTLATMGDRAGYRTLVLSGDRDAFQLIDDNTTVLFPGHHFKDLRHMTPAAVQEKYHVTPAQYPDLAALRGETADNIPGVPGVGDGFAAKWINLYGGLEQIIEHADEIGGKKGAALRDSIEQVKLNRSVNALVRDLDLGVSVDDLTFGDVDVDALDELCSELEFGSRTKTRVLKTFNIEGASSSAPSHETVRLELPQVETIDGADALDSWARQHLPAPEEHLHDADEHSAKESPFGFAIDRAAKCAAQVGRSWTLYADGNGKPGAASFHGLMLSADGHAAYIGHIDEEMAARIQHVLDRYHRSMTVHGYKEQSHILDECQVTLPTPLFDTKLAGYLVHPDFHAENIEQAASHFLDLHIEERTDAATQGTLDFDAPEETDENEREHAARTIAIIGMLAVTLAGMLDQREQYGLLRSIEMPVSHVLHDMEHVGAQVDMTRLTTMSEELAAEANQAQETAWEFAGEQVNLQSPKQLRRILFEDMGLKPTKKTKSGSYTTNAAALQTLRDRSYGNDRACQFLDALLLHREKNKLKQIVQTLIDTTNRRDGRIHTTFEQTVAATGRLSSVDPNLQNIPNRDPEGRRIRSAFVPGEGFEALLSSDYSQVELRIMADLSGDEALIEAFRSGKDFHKYVASLVYGIPVEEITPDQRSHVKAMSYGLAYGLSTYGLAQQLKIRPKEAESLRNQYFATFGKVHEYLESLVAMAREKGYTETIYGRRRYFPGLKSTSRAIREAAERAALNAPIQGSAADIMKIAMIRADQALREANLNSRIILQIHDELVVEIAPGEADKATEVVKNAMEHAVKMAVPLNVSTGIGSDWQLAAH